MSHSARIMLVVFTYIAVLVTGVIYAQAGQPLFDMLTTDFSGPFTDVAKRLDTLIPILLGAVFVGNTLYLIYGPVQEETARGRVRR